MAQRKVRPLLIRADSEAPTEPMKKQGAFEEGEKNCIGEITCGWKKKVYDITNDF